MKTFWKNTSGNVAMMTAIASLALFGTAGAAIDMMRVNDSQTHYYAAADAAALGAVSFIDNSADLDADALKTAAKAEAQRLWTANLTVEQAKIVPTPDVAIKPKGGSWTVEVKFTGKLPTSLMTVVGIDAMKFSGESVATSGVSQSFWDFVFAIDTSSSMGIGATQADMDAMLADPKIGCMFACHFSSAGDDTLAFARTGGYKLRLDVVDDAVEGTIDAIEAKTGINARASLFGMTTDVQELVPDTTKLSDIKDHNIQIAMINQSLGNTNLRNTMQQLTSKVGPSGDGSSASKRKRVVFLVTDGIHDSGVWEPNVHTVVDPVLHNMGPIDPAFCQTLKDNGNIVGVLYINYITPPYYEGYIAPYQAQVLPSLQSCASPGYFHDASNTSEIETAMKDILSKAFLSAARLTK